MPQRNTLLSLLLDLARLKNEMALSRLRIQALLYCMGWDSTPTQHEGGHLRHGRSLVPLFPFPHRGTHSAQDFLCTSQQQGKHSDWQWRCWLRPPSGSLEAPGFHTRTHLLSLAFCCCRPREVAGDSSSHWVPGPELPSSSLSNPFITLQSPISSYCFMSN